MHRLTVLELIRKSFGLGTGEIGFEGHSRLGDAL